MPLDPTVLGQVFTPDAIVRRMLALRKSCKGRVLEPSCGDGAFLKHLPKDAVAVEFCDKVCPPGALNIDFFDFPLTERFDTIIGNPPYVRQQDICASTRSKLDFTLLDRRANLFLFFIHKCVQHLNPGGELIFIVPRELAKLTSAARLNAWLLQEGSFTHYEETGDARIFANASPNCVIFRFERGLHTRCLDDGRTVSENQGQLFFTEHTLAVPFSALATVRVGGASGADACFAHPDGNAAVVCSHTRQSGETRRMFYDIEAPQLVPHQAALLARRIRSFDASNWWQWGRNCPADAGPRLYVNAKTRHPAPFFVHPARHFDASILGVFPRNPTQDLEALAHALNTEVCWAQLGLRCDGRLLLTQRSLEQCLLPASMARFVP